MYIEEITDLKDTIDGVSSFGSSAEVVVSSNLVNQSSLRTSAATMKYGPFPININTKFNLNTGKIPAGAKVTIILSDGVQKVSLPEMTVKEAPKRGWIQNQGLWFYYDEKTGVKKIGWFNDRGTWYYLNQSGTMQTGWMKSGTTWYYFNSEGAMQTGWLKDGATWYYFQGSGAKQTGWLQSGKTWYYFQSSGAMQTGRANISGTWYLFDNNGVWKS
ncbi:hypothetical protein ACIQXV_17195 [Neobacillus sp. NPDC097160]|uniref:hypothetical protein n=1 Tax=Neobacillus sp. NPDC097160 TaxID=3364298 RepID=UPI0038122C7E